MSDPSKYFPSEDFSLPERSKDKKRPAPKYTVRQLVSGCRVLQIINMPPTRLHVVSITHPAAVEVCMSMASTTERRKAPAKHTRVAREVHHE
jgi:hypothetical protein